MFTHHCLNNVENGPQECKKKLLCFFCVYLLKAASLGLTTIQAAYLSCIPHKSLQREISTSERKLMRDHFSKGKLKEKQPPFCLWPAHACDACFSLCGLDWSLFASQEEHLRAFKRAVQYTRVVPGVRNVPTPPQLQHQRGHGTGLGFHGGARDRTQVRSHSNRGSFTQIYAFFSSGKDVIKPALFFTHHSLFWGYFWL